MTDRFNGSINLGGSLTREQFKACCTFIAPLVETEETLDDNGQATFHECVTEDFAELVQYCEEQKIALLLQWDGKYEYGAMCEYWIDGKYQQFNTDNSGRIVVTVADLQEHANTFIVDYIKSLEIPEFPAFSIVNEPTTTLWTDDEICNFFGGESRTEKMRIITVFFSNGDTVTTSFDGTNDEIDKHYLGNTFETGNVSRHVALCVHIHDMGYKHGLMVRNIESDNSGRIKSVRRDTVQIDDNKSYDEIILTLYSGDEYALNDVWVYDMRGEWINTIGYRNETVKR